MKRTVLILICLSCLLTGCVNPFESSYVAVTPYEDKWDLKDIDSLTVREYDEFYGILQETVRAGVDRIAIVCPDLDPTETDRAMDESIQTLISTDPIANYVVREITYEWGKTGNNSALAVQVHYSRNRASVSKIQHFTNVREVENVVHSAVENGWGRFVFEIDEVEGINFNRMVETFSHENPDLVMEQPSISVSLYPETGSNRVVDISFYYQTDRAALLEMKEQVEPVFTSAELYLSGDADELEKFQQLFSFLMERYDYHLDTSITPSYSLLCHGVGDSKAFARVYAAMCRRSGLDCDTVTGTRRGESHSWNLITVDGKLYHLDLLEGEFTLRTDDQMQGYVWDYSAYPST